MLISLAACGGNAEVAASARPEASPAELTARVDRVVVNPGDVITFTLMADHRSDVSLELPEIADIFSGFRIVNSGVSQPIQSGERVHIERWYKLQADISGSYVIEPIEIAYSLPDGEQELARTPRIFIEVESLLEQDSTVKDIRDIKPPVSVSPSLRAFLLPLGLLAAAIMALLVGRELFGRLKRRQEARLRASKPAHEEAMEALDALMRKKLLERGLAREFCFEISEIFRRYMQARFRIPAIDLTTEEILPRVEHDGIIEERLKPLVREFLTNTDLVKFAKYRPTREELDKIIENTRAFIDRTTPAPAGELESAMAGGEVR